MVTRAAYSTAGWTINSGLVLHSHSSECIQVVDQVV